MNKGNSKERRAQIAFISTAKRFGTTASVSRRFGSRSPKRQSTTATSSAPNTRCALRHPGIACKIAGAFAELRNASSQPPSANANAPPVMLPTDRNNSVRPRCSGWDKSAAIEMITGNAQPAAKPANMRAINSGQKFVTTTVISVPAAEAAARMISKCARLPRSV